MLHQLTNKFLHRVRIHGGEFDSSARAMNRAGEKDTLITYERVLEAQADLRKFRGSTIERKQMSTKTTFKRVALVAVAALGFGLLSVAPSNAAIAADTLTVTDGTATIGDTVTATSATATISFLPSDFNTDSHSVTAALVSGPTGNTLFPVLKLAETTSAIVSTVAGDYRPETITAIGGDIASYTKVYVKGRAAAVTTAKFAVFIGTTSNTGVVTAGTYVVRITPAAAPTAGTAASKDITIVVAAAAKASGAYTHMVRGSEAAPTAALAAVDTAVSASKTATGLVGKIAVTFVNSSGGTVAESYTATITGAGTLGQGSNITTGGTILGRSITMVHGNQIHIFADGTGGVGTITIANSAGVVFATKTVSFYGDPAAITMSVRRELAPNSTLASDVVRAQVLDLNGYPVNGAVVYATSSDQTIIAADYSSFTTATDVSSAGVVTEGIAKIGLTGVKIGSAKITVGLAKSATDVTTTGYAIKSDATTINVVGSTAQQAGVIVTMDKQSYAPGSFAWVTITPVDAAGKKLAPNVAYTVFSSTGITSSQPVEVTLGTSTSTVFSGTVTGATSSNASTRTVADPVVELDGTKIQKFKLPNIEGDFTISWTTAAASNFPGKIAAGGVAGSVTVALANPGSQAAVDAATEATDAANAATDAALAAADAADAATAAAEDASAAVATLAKSVNTALGNLKKQITALTALVNKLLKR